MASFQAQDVQRFYDSNTRLMLRLGQGLEGSIHRAVWGPGVQERPAAMAYADRLIGERLQRLEAPADGPLRVVDLGSGVCASLCRIAEQLPIRGTGVTISTTQAELATERIAALGLAGSVRCVAGDFCALPPELGPADAAFGIESFVHAPSAQAFFQQAARLVRPGGYLMLCDDFLGESLAQSGARGQRWVERFAQGWVLSSLMSLAQADERARQAGFSREEALDLTPYLELGRPRDWAIALLVRGLGWLPIPGSYWSMLSGGDAAQACLKRGWVKYQFVVWRRNP